MNKKIVISPGQALLKLMNHYKTDEAKVEQLKTLYLSGVTVLMKDSGPLMQQFLADPVLSSYDISPDMQTINNDSVRRYFETHLSHDTLVEGLKNSILTKRDLETHIQCFVAMIHPQVLADIQHVLDGEIRPFDSLINKEFSELIAQVKTKKIFKDIPSEHRDTVELLIKSAFLGVINAQQNSAILPLNIYGTGMYEPMAKGKTLLTELYPQDNEKIYAIRSQNLGLLKGHMPLPLDDVARAETPLDLLKPSDQSTYSPASAWAKDNFSRLVQPFSNSISGTMLCQLRSIAQFDKNHQNYALSPSVATESLEKMTEFCKFFTCAMLFGSGGHTLHEYTAGLSLPAVKNEFWYIMDAKKDITLDSLFNTAENATAFNTALQKTIIYNENILKKAALHNELKSQAHGVIADQLTPNDSQIQLIEFKKSSLIRSMAMPPYNKLVSEMNEIKLISDLLVNEDYSAAMKQIDVVKNLLDGPWFTPAQNHYHQWLFNDLQSRVGEVLELNHLHTVNKAMNLKNELTAMKEQYNPVDADKELFRDLVSFNK